MTRMGEPPPAGFQPDLGLERLDQVFDLLNEVREEMDRLRKLLVYMTDINFSGEEALHQWERILLHRNDLRQRLNREVDLSVALADYFTHAYKTPTSPLVLARSRIIKLQSQASNDPVTGIYSRHFFDDFIQKEVARSGRQKSGFALVLLDVNDFKPVTDVYGHTGGDALLEGVSAALRAALRPQDIPCRYAEGEFICILPDTGYYDALGTAERMRHRVADVASPPGVEGKGCVAYGVAAYPWDGQEPADLVRACDRRLCEHKAEAVTLRSPDRRAGQRLKTPGSRAALQRGQGRVEAEVIDLCGEGLGLKSAQPLEVGATYQADLFLGPPLAPARAELEVLYLQEAYGSFRIGSRIRDITFTDPAA